jgi:pimeloyl-ACP methyl ester carboxylesterase
MAAVMTLAYERRGAGEPLLLLHGIGHRWQAWEPVLDRLAGRFDVVAIDLPGFGRSPVPETGMPVGMAASVTMLRGFLDTLGWERPHVAGNSLGGALALELAAAGRAASVTAFAPAGFYTRWERRWAVSVLTWHRWSARLPVPLLRFALRSGTVRAVTFGMLMTRGRRLSARRTLEDTLALRDGRGFAMVARSARDYSFGGTPAVPVTIAWGDRDRVLLPRQAIRAAARLPLARHETLRGCGHVPMGDDPDLVARLIEETADQARSGRTGDQQVTGK